MPIILWYIKSEGNEIIIVSNLCLKGSENREHVMIFLFIELNLSIPSQKVIILLDTKCEIKWVKKKFQSFPQSSVYTSTLNSDYHSPSFSIGSDLEILALLMCIEWLNARDGTLGLEMTYFELLSNWVKWQLHNL